MDKTKLLEKLIELRGNMDYEEAHKIADNLLIKYINDSEITKAYKKVGKWYA